MLPVENPARDLPWPAHSLAGPYTAVAGPYTAAGCSLRPELSRQVHNLVTMLRVVGPNSREGKFTNCSAKVQATGENLVPAQQSEEKAAA